MLFSVAAPSCWLPRSLLGVRVAVFLSMCLLRSAHRALTLYVVPTAVYDIEPYVALLICSISLPDEIFLQILLLSFSTALPPQLYDTPIFHELAFWGFCQVIDEDAEQTGPEGKLGQARPG